MTAIIWPSIFGSYMSSECQTLRKEGRSRYLGNLVVVRGDCAYECTCSFIDGYLSPHCWWWGVILVEQGISKVLILNPLKGLQAFLAISLQFTLGGEFIWGTYHVGRALTFAVKSLKSCSFSGRCTDSCTEIFHK